MMSISASMGNFVPIFATPTNQSSVSSTPIDSTILTTSTASTTTDLSTSITSTSSSSSTSTSTAPTSSTLTNSTPTTSTSTDPTSITLTNSTPTTSISTDPLIVTSTERINQFDDIRDENQSYVAYPDQAVQVPGTCVVCFAESLYVLNYDEQSIFYGKIFCGTCETCHLCTESPSHYESVCQQCYCQKCGNVIDSSRFTIEQLGQLKVCTCVNPEQFNDEHKYVEDALTLQCDHNHEHEHGNISQSDLLAKPGESSEHDDHKRHCEHCQYENDHHYDDDDIYDNDEDYYSDGPDSIS